MLLGDLQGRLFGLPDLFLDPFQLDLEVGVAAGFPADGSGPLLILAGVGSYVGEDAEGSSLSQICSILGLL